MGKNQKKSGRKVELPEDGEDLVSSEDAERINRVLGCIPDPAIPDADALNGLLTALVCSPRVVSYEHIMKLAMASGKPDEEIVWDSPEDMVWLLQFLRRHLIELHHLLNDDSRKYKPCIRCETRPGNHWARGFVLAATFQREDWDNLVLNEDYKVEMGIIATLANEQSENPSARLKSTEEIDEIRSTLLAYLPRIVTKTFEYFADQRKSIGESYPSYLAEMKVTLSNPAEDHKPEAERYRKQFVFNDTGDGRDGSAQSMTKRKKKKKKGGGKSKRSRW